MAEPDLLRATPDTLLKQASATRERADTLDQERAEGLSKLDREREEMFERRRDERQADTSEFMRRSTDLQQSTAKGPDKVAMPSADLGPMLDPKQTQDFAWGIFAMSLIGAAAGRKHWGMATAALDGMLRGLKEGSEAAYDEKRKSFEREFKLAKEKQAEAISTYEEILNSKKLSVNQMSELMRVHAAAQDDHQMAILAREKRFDEMYKRVSQMRTAADRMETNGLRMQDKIDARREKAEEKRRAAESGSEGLSERYRTDPEYKKQVDFWAKLVQSGQSLPPRFAQSGAGKKMYSDIISVVPSLGSGKPADISANRLNQREMTAEAQKLGTQSASVAIANKELLRFIPLAEKAIDEVPRSGWKPINQLIQAGENTWSPEQGRLVLANRSVLNAFAQLIQRGAPTVHSLTEAENLLNTADSPAVYKAKMKQLQMEGEQAEEGLKDAHDDLMRRARTTVGDESGSGKTMKWSDLK